MTTGKSMNRKEYSRIDLTVGACIVFEGKILLLFHTKLGTWLFPGGHIEHNETPDHAIIREVKEETGLSFIFSQYSTITKAPEEIEKLAIPFHTNTHNVGDHEHYGMFYLGTVTDTLFVKNHESKELKWFSAEEIQESTALLPSIKGMALLALQMDKDRIEGLK